MRRLPPLTALPAFEATARLGSVTAAAEELGRTHGAVSKQLQNLAADVEAPLFEKDGTGLKLTAAGEQFLKVVQNALNDLAAGWDALRQEKEPELFDLGLSSTLSQRWLVPRIAAFYDQHPHIELAQHMGLRKPFHVTDPDVHAVISWDRLRHDLTDFPDVEPIGDVHIMLVHAPTLEVDISDKQISTCRRLTQGTTRQGWQRWMDMTGFRVETQEEQVFPHTTLVINAAIAGEGIAVLDSRLLEQELADGRLVSPIPPHVIPGGFALLMTEKGRASAGFATFINWMRSVS